MVQALRGYFEDGRFVSTQHAKIPDYVEVYIIVTDKTISYTNVKLKDQREAFDKFTTETSSADILGDEFDEIISQGTRVQRELL